jgi:hypothetical protein
MHTNCGPWKGGAAPMKTRPPSPLPPSPSQLQPFVGQPILAAAAFQAASHIILRTSPLSHHNPLSATQRATPPPLGRDRKSPLRNLPLTRQPAAKSHLPAGTPHHRQGIRSDGSDPGQRPNRSAISSRTAHCRFSNTSYTRRREEIRSLPAIRLCSDGESRPHAFDSPRRSYEMAGAAERVHRP